MKVNERIKDPEHRLIYRLFFNSFYVFLISTLATALGAVIDGIIIGNTMNTAAIAAFGLITPLNFSYAFIGAVLGSGSQNLCTRSIAQGEVRKAREQFSFACYAGLALSVAVMFGVSIFSKPIILLLGGRHLSSELFRGARHYLLGSAIGLPAITGIKILTSFMSLDSDRMRAFYAAALMSVVNFAGDFLCVTVFHGGLTGIAAVTSLSYYAGFAVLLGHFFRKNILLRFTTKNLHWSDLGKVVVRGLPRGMFESCLLLHGFYINHVLAKISASAIAGYSVQTSLSYLTDGVVIGVAQGILVQGAMFFGEENRNALAKLLNTAMHYELLLVPALSVVCYLLAPTIAKLYLGSNFEAYADGINSVRWYTAALLFQGINLLYAYYLQISGNLVFANLIYVVEWVIYTFVLVAGIPQPSAGHVYRGIAFAHVLMLVTIVVNLMVKNHHFRITMDDVLALPKDFGVSKADEVSMMIESTKITSENKRETVVQASEMVRSFASRKGIDAKRTYAASLAVEEMTANIISHGFSESERPNILTVRAFTKHNELILQIRDDCDPFDPKKRLTYIRNTDPASDIGIRLTFGMAKDVSYTSAQHLNNLIIRI